MSSTSAAPPAIRFGRVLLRPFQESDVADRQRYGRDPDIIRMFGGSPAFDDIVPMTLQAARKWFEEVIDRPSPTHWAVQFENRFIGTARLHSVIDTDRRARYAVGLLDRNVLGVGLGTDVTRAVVEHGFRQMSLHRIDLRVLSFNTRAIRCYERCGFVREGRERDAALIGDQWHDDIIMGILENESRGR